MALPDLHQYVIILDEYNMNLTLYTCVNVLISDNALCLPGKLIT